LEVDEPRQKPLAPWRTLTNLRVLIVDDNATNRQILEEVLTNWRMRPVAVDSGLAGLRMLTDSLRSDKPFAVVLLDGHMPEMDGFAVAQRISRDRRLADLKVVMLTSAAQPEDVIRCRKLGVSGYLTKPIKQSELFDVIVSALGQPIPQRVRASQQRNRARSSQPALQVLLAEDNKINQLVATRILEKLGNRVTVVDNGREALEAAQRNKFDLIAMDVQMPEMDGLEATKAIRSWEKTTGAYTPIIALTAHAMTGDRERCLAAGMDGYTPKPIRIKELQKQIAQLIRQPATPRGQTSSINEENDVIDQEALLAGVDGNRSVLRKLVYLFLADYPQRLVEIKDAIDRGDADALSRATHTLKGSVGNFAAEKAFAAVQRMESIGRNGDLRGANEANAVLESELTLLNMRLRKLAMRRKKKRKGRARKHRRAQ
jgi:CheY-like chemotaxis protein/HPt (histidine-containing phosphotransfer) domain-containing protein